MEIHGRKEGNSTLKCNDSNVIIRDDNETGRSLDCVWPILALSPIWGGENLHNTGQVGDILLILITWFQH